MKHIVATIATIAVLTLTANAFGFTDNGDGTVTDETTNLTWQQSDISVDNWDEACDECNALGNGWRLPEIEELITLADFENGYMDPVFNTSGSNFWSNTEAQSGWAWSFNKSGLVLQVQKSNYSRKSLCVYGDKSSNENPFVVGTGGVEDITSNLTWQQADDGVERTFSGACGYCDNLELNGHSNWRMPTVDELAWLVYYHYGNNLKIYDPFDTTSQFENQHFNFWSDTVYKAGDYAYRISFEDGTITRTTKINRYFTRCVYEAQQQAECSGITEEDLDVAYEQGFIAGEDSVIVPDQQSVMENAIEDKGLKLDGTGSVHVHPNTISARTLKIGRHAKMEAVVTLNFDGYVVDKLATLLYDEGVVEAYIMFNEERIDITEILGTDGSYSVSYDLIGSKHLRHWGGKQWTVELFAVDVLGNTALVDSTYVTVEDWKRKP